MGTRSTIALEFADGSVSQVYCHWDGYLDGVGEQLVKGYSDPFKLRDLIDAGDMSSIGAPYTERGEAYEDVCARRYTNIDEYFADCQQEEYDYILTREQGWLVRCRYSSGGWVSIAEATEMEAKENV